jgi:hypothetical protein
MSHSGEKFGPALAAANQVAGGVRGVADTEDVRAQRATGRFFEAVADRLESAPRSLGLAAVRGKTNARVEGREDGRAVLAHPAVRRRCGAATEVQHRPWPWKRDAFRLCGAEEEGRRRRPWAFGRIHETRLS